MKVNVYVAAEAGGSARRICWYMGTSDAQVEKAIRIQLQLPRDTEFLLRDGDGDAVPVSATLPNGQHYTLVVRGDQENGSTTSSAISGSGSDNILITTDNCDSASADVVTEASSPKRRRIDAAEINASVAASVTASPSIDTVAVSAIPARHEGLPHRSIATIIEAFVGTFTLPIANDDVVSFIPNAGRFALYELYSQVVQDKKFHPKREDVFYKMTSMHCKVDRQRVNRYYQCSADNTGGGTAYVQCKPQGKGVLLRKYRKTGDAENLVDVVKIAEFISWLGLDPNEVVALYENFVDGFVPITKSDYRAHSNSQKSDIGV
ncbi:hypothetical protein V7S43_016307 [Phytophthora oleae]|uniref:Uncharacterized protein n=1 Tax=Phytophthora oleae TaxID=2107226 RepID=A0ABD3EWI4_9STRA